MIGELAICQNASGNGYIGGIPDGPAMWREIAHGDIRAGNFSLNGSWSRAAAFFWNLIVKK